MLSKRCFSYNKIVWILHRIIGSYLKNVFCPNLYVESSFQLLGILEVCVSKIPSSGGTD